MRIVHVITTIERGGAENAINSLAKVQVQNGYSVTVVPLKGRLDLKDSFQESGVDVDTAFVSKSLLAQIFLMRSKFRNADIFHAHLPRAEILLRLSKAQSGFFVTRHNTEPFFPNSHNLISKFLSRFVLQKTLGVISISQAVRLFLIDKKEMSARTRNTVIYYGYVPRYEKVVRDALNQNRCASKIEIGTISRLSPQKNLNLLIDLAKHLKEMNLDFRIRVVGDGPDRSLLESRIISLNLSSRMELLGKLPNVFPFLESLDFFVLTSNYEGLGLVLLEAMDAGLPIIAPRNSAVPEVLSYEHPGLFMSGDLVSLSSIFMNVLSNQTTRQAALGIQSSQLNMFSMEAYFVHHEEFYSASPFLTT